MDNLDERHTAMGKVIYELYIKPGLEDSITPGDTDNYAKPPELHQILQDPNHAPVEDYITKLPTHIPDDFLEHQLVHNLIQSYRVEFGTHGNGNPTGYGYDILETDHVNRECDVIKILILYKNSMEQRRIRSYVDMITRLSQRHKWFHEIMNLICREILPHSAESLSYAMFDSYSADNLHHPRLNYDPFDESLGGLIGNPFYKIIGYDEWRVQMLLEADYMNNSLELLHKSPNWFKRIRDWRLRYVLRKLITCITEHEEIEVTW